MQPGNSGGALVGERGNVVGVVSAELRKSAASSGWSSKRPQDEPTREAHGLKLIL